MNPILFGDAHWYLDIIKKQEKPLAQFILEDEKELLHLVERELKKGSGLIRTPTLTINEPELATIGLGDKLEAVSNIAVNAVRNGMTYLKADTLLAGVIGPYKHREGDHHRKTAKIYSEPAIFMIDKGADCLLIEGFDDLTELITALTAIKMVNSVPVPLSVFFRPDPNDIAQIRQWQEVADRLELELWGLELSPSGIAKIAGEKNFSEPPLGIQIINPDHEELDDLQLIENILDLEPTVVLAGEGIEATDWEVLKGRLREAQEKRF